MPHGVVRHHRAQTRVGDAHLTQAVLDRVFRQEYGRILAHLVGWSGSLDRAEEALQDALVAASQAWATGGPPRNPGAWLTTVARRKLISRLRRHREVVVDPDTLGDLPGVESSVDDYPDERLKLIFVCCHPVLPEDQRVALTLHALGGLTTAEVAAAYLTPLATMAQRLVRAKRRIAEARIGFQVPEVDQLSERLGGVLKVLYLIFSEGYAATLEARLIREDLCHEAIRLTRHLEQWVRVVKTDVAPAQTAELVGLLALMLLHEGRRAARLSDSGAVVLLADQDRDLWDKASLAEGKALLECALRMGHPGPYQVQAAILQVHCEAVTPDQTDWVQIMGLYRQLLRWEDTPVVRLNAAVAVGQVAGPRAALDLLEPLEEDLAGFPAFPLVRAQWRDRAGDTDGALADYRRARALVRNPAERALVDQRLARADLFELDGVAIGVPDGPGSLEASPMGQTPFLDPLGAGDGHPQLVDGEGLEIHLGSEGDELQRHVTPGAEEAPQARDLDLLK